MSSTASSFVMASRSLEGYRVGQLARLDRPNSGCCGRAFLQHHSCNKQRLVVAAGKHWLSLKCEQKLAVTCRGSLDHAYAIGRGHNRSDFMKFLHSLWLINEDKGRQDVLLNLAFQFEDPCAVRDDLRKTYEKCNDISQESRALICTLLKESSEKDRKLHLSMYGKATQLQK
ncbi:hypothetical protein Tco_1090986 [Tanacetum coccineum]|uniref:Uncharacterized protein n=1 Tax=Tanacetum coccineum TaxID=301880 RepID=A0ABQ5I7V8_9ASTR